MQQGKFHEKWKWHAWEMRTKIIGNAKVQVPTPSESTRLQVVELNWTHRNSKETEIKKWRTRKEIVETDLNILWKYRFCVRLWLIFSIQLCHFMKIASWALHSNGIKLCINVVLKIRVRLLDFFTFFLSSKISQKKDKRAEIFNFWNYVVLNKYWITIVANYKVIADRTCARRHAF